MVHDFDSIYEKNGGAYIVVDADISEEKKRQIVDAFLIKNDIRPADICQDKEHYICENHTKIPADITKIPLDADELLRLLKSAYEIDVLKQQQQQLPKEFQGTGDNKNQFPACSPIHSSIL